MVEQIYSLDRTGPEQAARKVADSLGIDFRSGDTLNELTATAQGTLMLSQGDLDDACRSARADAESLGRPCLHIDLMSIAAFGAARRIAAWLRDEGIDALHITGPDGEAELAAAVADVLTAALRLSHVEAAMPGALALFHGDRRAAVMPVTIPETVDQAVAILIKKFNFKERTRFANMSDRQLLETAASMERYFVSEFRLWMGNDALAAACRSIDSEKSPGVVILETLRDTLQSTNVLRVVK